MDEREFELINILGADLGANQREISRIMDLSLGMVNMLIRRLISKGYIRIEQLNKRKVQYLLTPKGFSEKMQKSIKYTLKTINSISLIRRNIRDVVTNLYNSGHRRFYLLSEPDLAMIIHRAFDEAGLQGVQLVNISEPPADIIEGIILIGKEGVSNDQLNGNKSYDLIS